MLEFRPKGADPDESRLALVMPELVAQLMRSSHAARRRAAAEVCGAAAGAAKLEGLVVSSALAALAQAGDQAPDAPRGMAALAHAEEERYMDLLEAVEAGLGDAAERDRAMACALAATAILNAFDADSLRAATEAIFEALQAMRDDTDAVARIVTRVLDSDAATGAPP